MNTKDVAAHPDQRQLRFGDAADRRMALGSRDADRVATGSDDLRHQRRNGDEGAIDLRFGCRHHLL